MRLGKTLYVTNRRKWRAWLQKHHKTEKEVWLVYYRKDSGKARIPYNDAVEEALCFGWIDSTVKSIDRERFAQRFSLRNPKSPYSQINKERLRKLLRLGRVTPPVRVAVGKISSEKFETPQDILQAVRANKKAWKNFQMFSNRYKRIRISFIDAARGRPVEFKRRLKYFIQMTADNRQFGFGIGQYF